MIPYDIDPSLHSAQPQPAQLDDGFSPPGNETDISERATATEPVDPALWVKSAF